jgi:hypothetical protein
MPNNKHRVVYPDERNNAQVYGFRISEFKDLDDALKFASTLYAMDTEYTIDRMGDDGEWYQTLYGYDLLTVYTE